MVSSANPSSANYDCLNEIRRKHFLITGATSGIGLEIAETLVNKHPHGAVLIVVGRSKQKVTRVCQKLRRDVAELCNPDGTDGSKQVGEESKKEGSEKASEITNSKRQDTDIKNSSSKNSESSRKCHFATAEATASL